MSAPPEYNSPSGSVCNSGVLDVKATEDNSFPLASLIPLFPDIKRHAKVRLEETEGVTGLLPIAVRVPKPQSAAAIFINEDRNTPGAFGAILAKKYLFKNNGIPNLPVGLGGWTSLDPTNTQGAGGTRCVPTRLASRCRSSGHRHRAQLPADVP